MRRLTKLTIIIIALLGVPFAASAESIGQIFSTGSEWDMFVDGWQGQAVVTKYQQRRNPKTNERTTVVFVEWQKHEQQLVFSIDSNGQRSVEFSIRAPNGDTIKGRGGLSDYTVKVVAGTTQTAADGQVRSGAWYARRTKGGQTSTGSQGSITPESGLKTQAVIDVAPQVGSSCTLTVSVSGSVQDVRSVWIQPDADSSKSKEYKIGSDGRFSGSVPAGALSVSLVAKGKVSLVGEGLSQRIQCPSGGQKSISARVDGITD